jgi:hypothetical protein
MFTATAIWPVSSKFATVLTVPKAEERIGPLGLEVGTGGYVTFIYVRSRGNMGYPFAGYEWAGRMESSNVRSTVGEDISHIRTVLSPTITDLAGTLKVSRQAIYDWQAGKPIAAENAVKLSELARAADLFALEGLRGTSQALRRPIKDGKNFFELIGQGTPADAAARSLIEIVRSEFRQRENLRNRLARRKRPSRESFAEMGAPMLDEKE